MPATKQTKMQIVQVDATCPICETGTLMFERQVEATIGLYVKRPKLQHRCGACGSTALLDATYPQHQMVPAE